MAPSPVPVLAVIILTISFQALLFGDELAERSFPSFEEPEETGGFFGAFDVIAAILKTIWGVVVFFTNLLTFNVPGAPTFIRVIVGSIMGGGLIWSIATLIKGT